MRRWMKRVRGALVMGVLWAVVWAPLGVLLGMIVDRDGSMDEPWIAVGAYPGFIGGVLFSIVLAIAARRRSFHELSLPRFTMWGALAGLLVGALPFVLGTPSPTLPVWLPVVFVAAVTLLSAASAAGSLALARMGEKRSAVDAGEERELAGDPRGGNVRP
jgi:hypothetical protein